MDNRILLTRGESLMTKNIVIADVNNEYVERLVSFIQKKYGDTYKIQIINEKSQLRTYIQKNKCEILLFAPELYDANIYFKNVKLPVVLLEDDEMIDLPDKLRWSINKYTRITKMIAYLEEEYEEVEKNRPIIYGMYSPAGGVGRSTIAVAAALTYAKAGKKVLYVNLEDIDGTGMFFEEEPVEPGFLEGYRPQDSYDTLIAEHIKQDVGTNVMYFERESIGVESNIITQLPIILERVIDNNIANIIVVDFSCDDKQINDQVLEVVDYLAVIGNTHMHAVYKLKKWLEMTHIQEKIKEKLKLVINQGKEMNVSTTMDVIGRIDKLYATNPLGLSEYIAQNQFLKLHGLV